MPDYTSRQKANTLSNKYIGFRNIETTAQAFESFLITYKMFFKNLAYLHGSYRRKKFWY